MAAHATLKTQLELHLAAVNAQIEEVKDEATMLGIEPHALRRSDGAWVLNDLLVAKSNVLLGLSNIALANKK